MIPKSKCERCTDLVSFQDYKLTDKLSCLQQFGTAIATGFTLTIAILALYADTVVFVPGFEYQRLESTLDKCSIGSVSAAITYSTQQLDTNFFAYSQDVFGRDFIYPSSLAYPTETGESYFHSIKTASSSRGNPVMVPFVYIRCSQVWTTATYAGSWYYKYSYCFHSDLPHATGWNFVDSEQLVVYDSYENIIAFGATTHFLQENKTSVGWIKPFNPPLLTLLPVQSDSVVLECYTNPYLNDPSKLAYLILAVFGACGTLIFGLGGVHHQVISRAKVNKRLEILESTKPTAPGNYSYRPDLSLL